MTDADVHAKPLLEPSLLLHLASPIPMLYTFTSTVLVCLERGHFPPSQHHDAMTIDTPRMRHQLVRRGHSCHRAIAQLASYLTHK